MPKVTVVTGYYNRADAVDMTIHSVLSQTFADIELIAFDDCSNDGTADRLLQLSEELQDPRFRVIVHESNRGFTQGMIDAIAASSSDYICVQGSGDVSLPARIERQVALLDAQPRVGAVGCWYTNVVSTSGARRPRRPSAVGVDFDGLLKGNVFSHGEVMMRRSAYAQAGGYRAAFKNCQDYDLWLRMVRVSELATVPEFLYERFIRFDGVSYDPRKFSVQARYFLLTRRIAQMPENEAAATIAALATSGPLPLIDKSDSALQKRYIKAALRSAVFGASREAAALAEENIASRPVRFALVSFIRIYGSPLLSPLHRIVSKVFGMDR